MANDYSQGHICLGDLSYSHYTVYYQANSFQTANNKHLCAIKWKVNGHYYWLTVISPSTSKTYSSGNVEDNINDYINQNRSNSHLYYKANYSDNINYPTFPITSNYRIAHNIDNIFDVTNIQDAKWLVECDIPIFSINTNDDFGKLNRYADTGDDSEADNYSDLHPTTLTITVKYDSNNFPNFYVKGLVEGGGAETGSVTEFKLLTDTNGGVITDTLITCNDSWNSFTYGEVGATYNTIDFNFHCEQLSDGALGAVDTYVGFTWVNNSGYNIIQTPSQNGKVILVIEEGYPSYDDNGGDNNPWQNTDSVNSFSGANKLTETYMLQEPQLISLGNFFWSSTFKDNIMGLCNYPLENVIALKAMPIIMSGTTKEIKVGNVTTGISGEKVLNADNYEVTIGKVFIPEYFENFVDYNSVNLQIYLPFIGYKEIDNLLCMNRWLRVKYVFDVLMGTCMAILEVNDINGEWMQYQCYQGNCGIDIAITSTNRASIENGYINAGLDTVSDILRGNVGGAIKNVFSASTQDFHSQSNGAGNPSLMNRLKNSCYVIVRRPKKFTIAKNYGHTYGFPCYKKLELSSLTGYTICENFDCSISNATDIEREEIKSLLENGVYIK